MEREENDHETDHTEFEDNLTDRRGNHKGTGRVAAAAGTHSGGTWEDMDTGSEVGNDTHRLDRMEQRKEKDVCFVVQPPEAVIAGPEDL